MAEASLPSGHTVISTLTDDISTLCTAPPQNDPQASYALALSQPRLRVAIVGGGWYGCHLAAVLSKARFCLRGSGSPSLSPISSSVSTPIGDNSLSATPSELPSPLSRLDNYTSTATSTPTESSPPYDVIGPPDVSVCLYERDTRIFNGASGWNQYRLHDGYHYPRSEETMQQLNKCTPIFINRYPQLIRKLQRNIYAIAQGTNEMNPIDKSNCQCCDTDEVGAEKGSNRNEYKRTDETLPCSGGGGRHCYKQQPSPTPHPLSQDDTTLTTVDVPTSASTTPGASVATTTTASTNGRPCSKIDDESQSIPPSLTSFPTYINAIHPHPHMNHSIIPIKSINKIGIEQVEGAIDTHEAALHVTLPRQHFTSLLGSTIRPNSHVRCLIQRIPHIKGKNASTGDTSNGDKFDHNVADSHTALANNPEDGEGNAEVLFEAIFEDGTRWLRSVGTKPQRNWSREKHIMTDAEEGVRHSGNDMAISMDIDLRADYSNGMDDSKMKKILDSFDSMLGKLDGNIIGPSLSSSLTTTHGVWLLVQRTSSTSSASSTSTSSSDSTCSSTLLPLSSTHNSDDVNNNNNFAWHNYDVVLNCTYGMAFCNYSDHTYRLKNSSASTYQQLQKQTSCSSFPVLHPLPLNKPYTDLSSSFIPYFEVCMVLLYNKTKSNSLFTHEDTETTPPMSHSPLSPLSPSPLLSLATTLATSSSTYPALTPSPSVSSPDSLLQDMTKTIHPRGCDGEALTIMDGPYCSLFPAVYDIYENGDNDDLDDNNNRYRHIRDYHEDHSHVAHNNRSHDNSNTTLTNTNNNNTSHSSVTKYTLTHVCYTPMYSTSSPTEAQRVKHDIGSNPGKYIDEINRRRSLMEADMTLFYPKFMDNFTYLSYFIAIKTKFNNSSASRVCKVLKEENVYHVMSAKVSTVIDAEEMILKALNLQSGP